MLVVSVFLVNRRRSGAASHGLAGIQGCCTLLFLPFRICSRVVSIPRLCLCRITRSADNSPVVRVLSGSSASRVDGILARGVQP